MGTVVGTQNNRKSELEDKCDLCQYLKIMPPVRGKKRFRCMVPEEVSGIQKKALGDWGFVPTGRVVDVRPEKMSEDEIYRPAWCHWKKMGKV